MKVFQICVLLLLVALPLCGTKYAGEVFAVSPGVLSSAMGSTGLTYGQSFAAGWWNPALLAVIGDNGIEVMRSQHFEGLMNQNQISLILGSDSHSSIIINHLAIDDVKLTRLENPDLPLSNENRPIVWKTVSNQDFIITGAIGRSLKPKLYAGLAPKLAYRSLADKSGYAFGADLGLLWQPVEKVMIGAALRDFFSTQVFWEDSEHELVTPNLDLELGYKFKAFKKFPVHAAVRSELRADNMESSANMGSFGADFHAGMALEALPNLRLLGGYDVDTYTAGLGIKYRAMGVNYAFRGASPDGLGYSQRVSASYQW